MSQEKISGYENKSNIEHFYYNNEEINLYNIFKTLFEERWFILITTLSVITIFLSISLFLDATYRAEVTLVPAQSEQSGNSVASQFGSAAAFLGVSLDAGSRDKVSTAIAIMNSRDFIGKFIERHKILVPMFAGDWDKATNSSVIDDAIYNENTEEWKRKKGKPLSLEAFRMFRDALSITGPERDSNLVNVSIVWKDPVLAKTWANKFVSDLNREIKEHDVNEANVAIHYLQELLNATELIEMRNIFFQLIESQTRIVMLADVREDYVFRVIDPAVIPDQRFSPRYSVIAVLGFLSGLVFALILVILKRVLIKEK